MVASSGKQQAIEAVDNKIEAAAAVIVDAQARLQREDITDKDSAQVVKRRA